MRGKLLDNDGWALTLQTLHNDGPISDLFLVITAQCHFNICTYHENTSECIRETDLAAFAFPFHNVNLIRSFEIQAALAGESLMLANCCVMSCRGVDTRVPVRNMHQVALRNTVYW